MMHKKYSFISVTYGGTFALKKSNGIRPLDISLRCQAIYTLTFGEEIRLLLPVIAFLAYTLKGLLGGS